MPNPFDPSAFLVARGLADARGRAVEPMAGGYQNEVFRVRGAGIDWVVKRFHPAAEVTLFPNLPDAEAMALQRLAPRGGAPRSVGYFPDGGEGPVLVYEFYEGQPWSGDVAAVADLLRAIAGVEADGFRRVPMVPRDILAQGDAFAAACPSSVRERLEDARPRPIDMEPGARSLIHTDFGPGNLIAGAQGLKAIDWQCPAAGDAAEDLAAFLSPAFQILYGRAPLTKNEETAFLAAYRDAKTVERLQVLRPFFDWRMMAYCAMRQADLATNRPAASERYRLATLALQERLP